MVEQRSPKPTVEGSSPSAPASKPPFRWFLCFWAPQNKIAPRTSGHPAPSPSDRSFPPQDGACAPSSTPVIAAQVWPKTAALKYRQNHHPEFSMIHPLWTQLARGALLVSGALTAHWEPFVQVGNVKYLATSKQRQPRYRIGSKYMY